MQITGIMRRHVPVLAVLVLCVLFRSMAADAQHPNSRGAATPIVAAKQSAATAAHNSNASSRNLVWQLEDSSVSSSSSPVAHKSSSSAPVQLTASTRTLQSITVKPSGWEKLVILLEQKKAATLAANSSNSSSKSPAGLPIKATSVASGGTTSKLATPTTTTTTTTSSSSSSSIKGGGSTSSSSKIPPSSPIKTNSSSTKSSSNSNGTKAPSSSPSSSTAKSSNTTATKASSKNFTKPTTSSGSGSSSSGSKPAADTLNRFTGNATAAAAAPGASPSGFATKSNSTTAAVNNSTPASSHDSSQGSKSNEPAVPKPATNASAVVQSGEVAAPAAANGTSAAAAAAAAPDLPPPSAAPAAAGTDAVAIDTAVGDIMPRNNTEITALSAATAAANSRSGGNNSSNSNTVSGGDATVAVADTEDGATAGVLIGGNGTGNSIWNGTAGNTTDAFANICTPLGYTPPPRGRPAPPLTIRDATLVNKYTGRPVRIQGLNWFGFNVDMGMVDGLWAGGTDAATDFSKIAYQLRMLGFNAIRLPFAHKFLAKTDVWNLNRECAAIGATKLKDRLIAPEDATRAVLRKSLPANPSVMRNEPGRCNTYLPQRSNQDRLLFVVQQFVALGFYVVLDYQPQGLEQEAYNLHQFVDKWKSLWKQVTCLPNFQSDIAGRVLIDVMNEPDSMGIRWEAQGDRPGAEQLYLATADALWKMSPKQMLFMFEGTGQNMFGLNWGNGFITDLDIINSRGLSNPNSFFQQLVNKPYAKHSLISPHLYPPSITKSTWLGEELWKQSNTSFGYLQSKGYCISESSCKRLPVLVGETGSAYEAEDDKKWLEDFADFVLARGNARQYNQVPLAGWMWWAYNENSGDTGGIVHNNWQDLHWGKLRYLMNSLGLRPWYKQQQQGRSRRSPIPPTHRRPDRDIGRTPRAPRSPDNPPPPPADRVPSPPRRDDRESRRDRRSRRHPHEDRSSRRHRRDDRRPADQLEQLFFSLTR